MIRRLTHLAAVAAFALALPGSALATNAPTITSPSGNRNVGYWPGSSIPSLHVAGTKDTGDGSLQLRLRSVTNPSTDVNSRPDFLIASAVGNPGSTGWTYELLAAKLQFPMTCPNSSCLSAVAAPTVRPGQYYLEVARTDGSEPTRAAGIISLSHYIESQSADSASADVRRPAGQVAVFAASSDAAFAGSVLPGGISNSDVDPNATTASLLSAWTFDHITFDGVPLGQPVGSAHGFESNILVNSDGSVEVTYTYHLVSEAHQALVDSLVMLKREFTIAPDGHTIEVCDVFTSVDAGELDAAYVSTGAPGAADTVSTSFSGPTAFANNSTISAPSTANLQFAADWLSWKSAPATIRRQDDSLISQFTAPLIADTPVEFRLGAGTEADPKTAALSAGLSTSTFIAPAVTFTTPTDGSKSDSARVIVKGTATDNKGVNKVVVNGVAAMKAADGSWVADGVKLFGGGEQTLITAVATDTDRNTAAATISVRFDGSVTPTNPPSGSSGTTVAVNRFCIVPDVRHLALKKAVRKLAQAGCRAKTTKKRSLVAAARSSNSTVILGFKRKSHFRVIGQTVQPGLKLKLGEKVTLIVVRLP